MRLSRQLALFLVLQMSAACIHGPKYEPGSGGQVGASALDWYSRTALAQPKPPDGKFYNLTVLNSLSITNDLTVGDDAIVSDSFWANRVTTNFADAGTVFVHGPLTFDGSVTGCRINPNQDSNFLYFQNCNLRTAQQFMFGGLVQHIQADVNFHTGSATSIVDSASAAPSVTACAGGTAATMTWAAGSANMRFDVGTACTGESTAVITLPATVTNCWTCTCFNTAQPTHNIKQSACSTTTATMTNYAATLATVTDWADGADIQCSCRGG